jgi:hypothetical protein
MSTLGLVNVLDVARSLGLDPQRATPEHVADWLRSEYLKKRGGGFNYDPVISSTYRLFRGDMVTADAVLHCLTSGNPKGRQQNSDVAKLIGPYAEANISTCYKTGYLAVCVGRIKGRSVYVGLKAPFVRVCHDEAYVMVPGYRRGYRPVERQIDVVCSVVRAQIARDDYAVADVEYLSAGPGIDTFREFRAIQGKHRKLFSADEVDQLLDIYIRGVALLESDGVEIREPEMTGYRVVDPSSPTFF